MKVRIVEKNEIFYPQYRFLWMWCSFTEGYADVPVLRYSLSSAQDYLDEKEDIRKITNSKKVVIRKPYKI